MNPLAWILGLLLLPIGQTETQSESSITLFKPGSTSTPAEKSIPKTSPWKKPLLSGPMYSTRELSWRADLILRVEPGPANSWRLLEVLHKDTEDPVPLTPPAPPQMGMYPRTAREWTGFWQKTPSGWSLLPTGVRAKTAEGKIWIPGSVDDIGDYDRMVENIRADLRDIGNLKNIWIAPGDITRRQKKLWDWVGRNGAQFGGGILQNGPPGWGSLEQDLLTEVLLGPDDNISWEALNFYARTNGDQLPPLKDSFDNTARRNFLLEKAVHGKLLGERVRALRVLGAPQTWNTGSTDGQWEKLGEILKIAVVSSNPEIAGAATATASNLGPFKKLDPALALAAWTRYLEMPMGRERGLLASQIARMTGEEVWKARTGNEATMVVGFEKLVTMDDKILWTLVKWEGTGGPSKLDLVREKIDDMGQVKEVQTQPLLGADNKPWNPAEPLGGEWSVTPWPVGLWRIHVESKANPSWKSEPRMIKIAKPLKLPIPGIQPLGTNSVVIDAPMPKSAAKQK